MEQAAQQQPTQAQIEQFQKNQQLNGSGIQEGYEMQIAQQARNLANLNGQLKVMNATIEDMQGALMQAKQLLEGNDAATKAKDAEIEALKQQLADKLEIINGLKAQLATVPAAPVVVPAEPEAAAS